MIHCSPFASVLIEAGFLARPVRRLERKWRIISGIKDAAYTAEVYSKQFLLNEFDINILNALTQAMSPE